MENIEQVSNIPKWQNILGLVLKVIAVLFLAFDVTIHLLQIKPVMDAFAQLGYSADLAIVVAIIELVCLTTYLIPRTSVLGAVLMTGYLGGAVATNLRAHMPLFGNVLFPVYIGIMLWAGLWLRSSKIRQFIP